MKGYINKRGWGWLNYGVMFSRNSAGCPTYEIFDICCVAQMYR